MARITSTLVVEDYFPDPTRKVPFPLRASNHNFDQRDGEVAGPLQLAAPLLESHHAVSFPTSCILASTRQWAQ